MHAPRACAGKRLGGHMQLLHHVVVLLLRAEQGAQQGELVVQQVGEAIHASAGSSPVLP